jgi:cytochrome c oxidase cbb3-type subunit III
MSDFLASGWGWFITATTVIGLVACVVLLLVAARHRVMAADDNSTGHVWDGDLRELNNPLPSWWLWLFVGTVVFSGGYLAVYPGLGSFAGYFGWSSDKEWQDEQAQVRASMAPVYARFAGLGAAELARDAQAMGIGERLFLNNCAGCHGADARGSKGFPNLTDTDWLWGGSPQAIAQTITKGRQGSMPPMAAAVGSADDVRNVAHYVLSLSGGPHDSVAAALGRPKFGACAACHGVDGKGNQTLGAPNLADGIWLHGWGEQAVVSMVTQGKVSLMPAFEGRLSTEQIQLLAAWVWSRSSSTTPN